MASSLNGWCCVSSRSSSAAAQTWTWWVYSIFSTYLCRSSRSNRETFIEGRVYFSPVSVSIMSIAMLHQRKDAILTLTPSSAKFQKYGGRVDNHIVERLWYSPGLVLGDTYSIQRMSETLLWSMAILWVLIWTDFRVDLHLVVLYYLLLWKLGTRRNRYITGDQWEKAIHRDESNPAMQRALWAHEALVGNMYSSKPQGYSADLRFNTHLFLARWKIYIPFTEIP